VKYQLKTAFMGFVTAIAVFLSACNSSNETLTLANGGLTGTGITMGRITNFGSIFVNGVRFDVDNATFIRDKSSSLQKQTDFSVGEFVVIKGSIDADGINGIATEVSYSDILKGEITNTSTDGVSLEILGQLVHTNSLTVLHGVSQLSELQVGNIVEVSGVLGAKGHIIATHLKLRQNNFTEGVSINILKGTISNSDTTTQQFEIQGVVIEYSNALLENYAGHEIHNDQYVEVESKTAITGNTLTASTLRLINEEHDLANHHTANVEGLISRYVSAIDFDINGLPVTTTTETRYNNGNVNYLNENVFIKLKGTVQTTGVLIAENISFETQQAITEVEGAIQAIDLIANEITLATYTIIINNSTLMIDENNHNGTAFSLNDLSLGEHLSIKGIVLSDGKLLASKLEKRGEHSD
jgi:hypothetical protein